jgi:coenzyme F420-dependent glucose-6-phosphate dehydrogenase
MDIGYSLSSEEHAPLDLARNARRAEDAGFGFALISDHFHPWVDRQGHSPFVWSVIGGVAIATSSLRLGTGVTCPTIRIHPAIIAQAAATAASMMPGRFFLGLGTGENLNEHILGDRWPSAAERRERLREAVGLMRELWEGELCSFEGEYYRVDNARIYTLPNEEVSLAIAAGGPEAAELAGELDAALITTAPEAELVERYVKAGGTGPRYGQLTVCWATSEREARATAFEWWPNAGLQGPLAQELPLPEHFEQAVAMVTEDDVAETVVCGPDPGAHLEAIEGFAQAGFDHVYVHQVGPDQAGFLDFYANEIVPEASEFTPRARAASGVSAGA